MASATTRRAPRRGGLGQGLGAAAGAQRREGQVADAHLRLAGEPAAQVGVGHRGERVALHAALAEEPVADEEMALVDRPPGVGEGRADQGHVAPEEVEERRGDRTDVALRRRVEGRAVLEHDLAGPGGAQRLGGGDATGRRRRRPEWNATSARRRRRRRPGRGRPASRGGAWSVPRRAPACWRCRWRR